MSYEQACRRVLPVLKAAMESQEDVTVSTPKNTFMIEPYYNGMTKDYAGSTIQLKYGLTTKVKGFAVYDQEIVGHKFYSLDTLVERLSAFDTICADFETMLKAGKG